MKAPSNIVPCSMWHLLHLCENMRADEIEQYLALTGAERYNPEIAANGMFNMGGHRFTLVGDRLPVVAGGYCEVIPGVWNSWMVGTDEGWEKHWRSITRASRWMIDFMFNEVGARRIETMALSSRTEACYWYERSLGMVYEGTRSGFGMGGEDVAFYGRKRPQVVTVEEVNNGQRRK